MSERITAEGLRKVIPDIDECDINPYTDIPWCGVKRDFLVALATQMEADAKKMERMLQAMEQWEWTTRRLNDSLAEAERLREALTKARTYIVRRDPCACIDEDMCSRCQVVTTADAALRAEPPESEEKT